MTTSRVAAIIGIAALALVLAVFGPPPKHAGAGNTLRITSESPPDYLDPAMSYMVVGWQTMVNVYNGLLTYPKKSGPAGAVLVPDLAVAMPKVSDGGRTFTFTMRRGAMWGPPLHREILPSDIKYGIERDLKMASPGSSFYVNLVGAVEVQQKKATEISGIVVDDGARTITFHLKRPDATFLNVLALPFSFAVPKGTPLKDQSLSGFVPASGPYMFTKYDPQGKIVLERNPNFKQWGPNTPPGFVDRIEILLGVNTENAITLIKRGEADYIIGGASVPRSKLPGLLADKSYAPQLHIESTPTTSYLFMNTQREPFNTRAARQAINWAIDRKAMVKLSGGLGTPTETILPPSIPGYAEHHLYPKPDIDKARALLAEAGVKPGKIDIWCRSNPPNPDMAVYLQGVMTQLGFTPTVKCIDSSSYFTVVGNSKTKALIGLSNWSQDFPEGSNFIDVLLNGAYIDPEHSNNLSFYHGADKDIAKANLELDPAKRAANWQRLDKQIVEDAAWAPFMHGTSYVLVSKRMETYVNSPVYELLFMMTKIKGQTPHLPEHAASGGGGPSGDAQALPPVWGDEAGAPMAVDNTIELPLTRDAQPTPGRDGIALDPTPTVPGNTGALPYARRPDDTEVHW